MDYDKKFQDDLEKAAALSLESLALDHFRRNRHLYSTPPGNKNPKNDTEATSTGNNTTSINSTKACITRPRPESLGGSAQLTHYPVNRAFAVQSSSGSIAAPANRSRNPNDHHDTDLISFANPDDNTIGDCLTIENRSSSVPSSSQDCHEKFKQIVNEIHRGAQYSMNNLYGGMASTKSQEPVNQLVPYVDMSKTKQTLDADALNKLYNMSPFTVQTTPANTMYLAPYYPSPNFSMYKRTNTMQTSQWVMDTNQSCFEEQPIPSFHDHPTSSLKINQRTSHSPTITNIKANEFPICEKNSIDCVNISLSQVNNNRSPRNPNYKICDISVTRNDLKRYTSDQITENLIDLENGIENSTRVSVLEAFDPLTSKYSNDFYKDPSYRDGDSEFVTSYYEENDPFDYLYSCGTHCSDPVYEAINKIDRSLQISSSEDTCEASDQWNIQQFEEHLFASTSAPPLPPRNTSRTITADYETYSKVDTLKEKNVDRLKIPTKLYENVIEDRTYDGELVAFFNMVKRVRSQFKYDNEASNIGHIVASEHNNHYPSQTEIKLLVHPLTSKNLPEDLNFDASKNLSELFSDTISINPVVDVDGQIAGYGPPVVFTCDIETTVDHVLMHVFCELEGHSCFGSVNDYILKPIGINEWLKSTSKISQLECVHHSVKLEQDVQLGLWPRPLANLNALSRTEQDDKRAAEIKLEHIVVNEPVEQINYNNLIILLETLEDEISKLQSSAAETHTHKTLSQSGVVQAVKMICALFGSVDTININSAIDDLSRTANLNALSQYNYHDSADGGGIFEVNSDVGDYTEVKLRPKTLPEQIRHRCDRVRETVESLIETFSHAFRVNFCVRKAIYQTNPIPISNLLDAAIVHIQCLHRIPPHWKHDYYMLGAQIYHGTRYISEPVVTQCSNKRSGLFESNLKFDSWLQFDNISISTLPRESRLIFVMYGCTTEPADNNNQTSAPSLSSNTDITDTKQKKMVTKVELGWSSIQFFDFDRRMSEGSFLLPQWPPTTDKFLGPAPARGTHPHSDRCPTLSINLPNYGGGHIEFPSVVEKTATQLDFDSLDKNLQQDLIDTADKGFQSALDKREVFWEKRNYLHTFPHALPKVLHAAHKWDYDSVSDLYALLNSWQQLSPLQALQLFLPRFPDIVVRAQAVKWMSVMTNDQLCEYLPQLLQALKHDCYDVSALAEFLLTKALESPRIAHHLYWSLAHCLPGEAPQNTGDVQNEYEDAVITMARYNRRNRMMLRALLAVCGEKLTNKFDTQNVMCKNLSDIASSVKNAKETLRQKVLTHGMDNINQMLVERPTALPLGPSLEVSAVNSRTCGYFNSNTLPLRINFVGPDRVIVPAIFKVGDDLQQDMLTIQLVRLMDRLWLEEGLDLKMVTFNCIPTGHRRGMIELISDAETLRKIQVEWGLTGSFKDKPIAEWLERQNPSQLEYQRAVDNFTVSCAGYCVVCYILGICDRHNDNIMLKRSGHLFHIDFGKFLGDAQMFGNFKRDRTPFVLTSDMAYVINMGDKPSIKFQHFVDLCSRAFNIVRKHGDLVLHMLALMASSGIPGVTADAVGYVRNALLPGQSNAEASASFAKLIQLSLKSWFPQFNFFLHNLAQLRFTPDDCNGELLSFVPRTYTLAQDGRLKTVTVYGYQKRYDLEKYYIYILQVRRQNQPDPAYLFRSYKEFVELHQKLLIHFPLAKLHSFSSGMHVGRSNIKTVAERRMPEIRHFLVSLFESANEIAHSDLVYTFFHPIYRDQQEQDIHVAKVKDHRTITSPGQNVCGEIKISAQYHRGALTVMIHHARSLPPSTSGQEPNTYAKAYLKPDPTKSTKRKTKVVRKTCFPTFMETLEYRMPLEIVKHRLLQVTVWSHDSLQENEFLGGVDIDLSKLDLKKENVEWFRLGRVSR